jgi:hypothetical protein
MRKPINLVGQKFGRLTVLDRDISASSGAGHHVKFICICDCGNKVSVSGTNLRRGISKSCGCLRGDSIKQRNVTHCLTGTRLHKIWIGMKERCYTTHFAAYQHYGGRGIKVCDEWKDDFQAFYDWAMSNEYDDTKSIDRIDSDGNYEPSNCRWVTYSIQNKNKRTSKLITFQGKTQNLVDWERETGIDHRTIDARLKYGWSIEDALTRKVVHT